MMQERDEIFNFLLEQLRKSKGYKKYSSLFLSQISDELRLYKEQGFYYSTITELVNQKYNVNLSYDTVRKFFQRSPNSQTLRSNFCKNSNETDGARRSTQSKTTQNRPPENESSLNRGRGEAAAALDKQAEANISLDEKKLQTTPLPSVSSKTNSDDKNKEHELAPIGVERKYSLEELFPDKDDRFDVYALTLTNGLDQEVEDEEIEEIFDLIKYRAGLEDTDDRVRDHEKIRHYLDLMWRMLKLGYTYDPLEDKYDGRFRKITGTLFRERMRMERELGLFQKLDKPRRHANISIDIKKVNQIRKNWLQRNLEKVGIRKKEEK